MLDTILFLLTLIVFSGIFASFCALILATALKPNKNMQAPLINNAVNNVNDAIDLLSVCPSEMARWSANNIGYTILLVLCVYAHYQINANEGQFLTNINQVYHDVNEVWSYAIFAPVSAFAGVLYGTVVPVFNFVFVPATEALWGAIDTLLECNNPLDFINALLSIPIAFGKLALSFVHVFDTQNGSRSWMENEIDIASVVQFVQENIIQRMLNNVDCLCTVMQPTIDTIGNVITNNHVAQMIHAAVNLPWRVLQMPVQFAAPQYHYLNATPVFQELRDMGYHTGAILDETLHGFVRIAHQNADVPFPKPSLGMALGRAWGGYWSLVELPINMIAAAVGKQSIYEAADGKLAFNHFYAAIQALGGGLNALMQLFTTGNAGKKAVLTCNSFDYDFYKSYELNFPKECICVSGSCGIGNCDATGTECSCQNGAVHAVPDQKLSKCVLPCTNDLSCNNPFETETVYGTCNSLTGQCSCFDNASLDVRTGKCSPNTPPAYALDTSAPNCKFTSLTGPPLPCAVQSAAMALIGALYTSHSFARELILQFPPKHSLWDTMQNYDGMWYPRHDSVTCEYRKNRKDDFSIDTNNCQCSQLDDDPRLLHFDPWCGRPTLNANVYNHMDALAFYAGYTTETGITGGMGTYQTFLSDSFGLAFTNIARTAVEQSRILSHLIAGFVSFATSMASALTSDPFSTPNLMQLPFNCHWGSEFDGPLATSYYSVTEEAFQTEDKHYQQIDCTNTNACTDKVIALKDSWPQMQFNRNTLTQQTQLQLLNDMKLAHEIYIQHNKNTCEKQAHRWASTKCELTNDDDSCYCNVRLEWKEGYQCRCVAFYPESDVDNDDQLKSALYRLPWCNSMFLEWSYYRIIESSVAVKNFLARIDSSNPVSAKIESHCYDGTQEYTLSQTHSVVKAFQPDNNGGFTFIGNKNDQLKNYNLCIDLAEADKNVPQWILFDEATNTAQFPFNQPSLETRQNAYADAPTSVFSPNDIEWQNFNKQFTYTENGVTYQELTDKVFRLHPQTCGAVAKNDNLVFQPCAHTCVTPMGNNRCWCDVKVSNDITCNLGNLVQQGATAAVDQYRKVSGATIAVVGFIQGGMRINFAQGFCDLSRIIGSLSATIASILTGQLGGEIPTAIRFRIASLLFSVFDTLLVMPLTIVTTSVVNDDGSAKTTLEEGVVALESAAWATMYQELFRDLFGNDSNSRLTSTAALAGSLVANGLVINVKFTCIYACNVMNGVQNFIFAHDQNAPGSEIIPTIEDFVDVIIKLLDEVYTNLLIMAANMIAGFMGLVTGGPPTIGEWLGNALDVIIQIIDMINAPEHLFHFLSIFIAMLPDTIRPIVKAWMSTLCVRLFEPLNVIADGINHIPFVGSIFPNPFGTLEKECLHPEDLGTPIDNTDQGNRGFNRRLMEDRIHWEGDTFCAHYGRANHTHDEHYEQCVRNRHLVSKLRQATQRNYFPWTLMDDWKQPAYFMLQTLHGVFLYFTIGEARMLQWSRAGYPVEASLDLVRMLTSLELPTASITGAAQMTARIYPDFAVNNRSTGYHLMQVFQAINHTKFPNLNNLRWGNFYDSAYDAVVSVSQIKATSTVHESLQSIHRRLYAAMLFVQEQKVAPVVKHLKCDQDDSGVCIQCNFLQKFVTGFKLVSQATADYYEDIYSKQIDYFFKVLSYANKPGTQDSTKLFNFVVTNQYAHDNTLPFEQPKPLKQYTSYQIQQWPTADNWKQFFIPHQNINTKVPFFGHSLWYYLQYPLRPCDTYKMAYQSCKQPHYSMSDATMMTVQLALATEVFLWMMPISLPFVFKFAIYLMSFMIFRYDYVPRCLPVLPWCLLIDWQSLLYNIFPAHLCQLVPALVTSSCTEGLQEFATYKSCPRNELGIFDPVVFLWRWKLPDFFYNVFADQDYGPAIQQYIQEIVEQKQVTSLQTTCFYLAIFDVFIVFAILNIAARLIVPTIRASLKSIVSSSASIAISVPYVVNEIESY